MCDDDVRCRIRLVICDEDVCSDLAHVIFGMYCLIYVVLCVVCYYEILCVMKWVFINSFWGCIFLGFDVVL